LAAYFDRWVPSLGIDRDVHQRQPTKAEMKRRMIAINHAALLLANSLSDSATCEFLEGAGSVNIENRGGIENALRIIAERAAIAAKSHSNTKGKTTSGRGKGLPPGAYSSKVYCAILIAETWKHFRGDYPLSHNRNAAAAADAFWRLSGGKATGWGSDRLNGWKRHFKTAQATEAAKDRAEVRRHLALSARHG
jgi:hypothetical protein